MRLLEEALAAHIDAVGLAQNVEPKLGPRGKPWPQEEGESRLSSVAKPIQIHAKNL